MKAASWMKTWLNAWQACKRWQRMMAYLACAFVVYLVVCLSLLPWLLKQQLETQLTELSGHPVSVQQVSFHPLKLSLTLRQFAIAELEPKAPQVLMSFDRLYVDFSLSSLFYWSWNFERFELDGLFFHLSRQKDGSFNINSLFPSAEAEQELSEESSSAGSVPRLRIDQFALRQAELILSDYQPEQPIDLSISRFDLAFSDFYTQNTGDDANAYSIDAQVGDVGRLSWRGLLDLPASQISGQLSLADLHLPNLFDFLHPYTDMRIGQGSLSLSTDYLINFQDSLSLNTQNGQLAINGFEVDAFAQPRASFQTLSLQNMAFDLRQGQIELGDIALNDARLVANFSADSQLDWLSWIDSASFTAADESEPAATASSVENMPLEADNASSDKTNHSAWRISSNSVELNQLAFELGESWLGTKKTHQLAFERVKVGRFSSDMQLQTPISVQALVYDESPLQAELMFDGPAQALTGELGLSKFSLSQLEKWYRPFVQLNLQQGSLSFNTQLNVSLAEPFNVVSHEGQLQVEQLNLVPSASPDSSWLSNQSFTASGISFDLNRQALAIAKLDSQNLQLSAAINQQGQLDFLQDLGLASGLAEAEAEAEAEPEPKVVTEDAESSANEQTWLVNVAELEARNTRVNITELFSGQPLEHQLLAPHIMLGQISSDFATPIKLNAQLEANQGGALALQGLLDIAQQQVDLDLQFKQWQLAFYQPYVEQYTELALDSAALSSKLKLHLTWLEQPELKLQGPMQIDDLALKDQRSQSDLLSWSSFTLNNLNIDSVKQELALGEMNFIQPYFSIEIADDFSTNLSGIVKPTDTAEPSESESSETALESSPWQISLAETKISQGLVDFADNSLSPNFSARIEQVEGRFGAISQDPNKLAEVSLSGEVDGYAPVSFAGEVAPLAKEPAFDAALDFKHLELTRLSAYSGTYAGYVIERGQMSLALAYKLQQGQLQGSNQVYIEQLQLGQRTNSDKATSLPVELAIALLEDDKGVIDLGLEVSGDVNDPDFNVAGLVFKALGNAIKKIITSPFSLLGSLIGSDETLNQLVFDGGSSLLTELQNNKLGRLVEGLAKRPQLKMAIIGSVDPVLDVPVLKRQHLAEQLNLQAKLDLPTEQINLSKVLEEPALRRALEWLSQQRLEDSLRQEQRKQITAKLREQQQLSPENVNVQLYSLWYQLLVEQIKVSDAELEDLAEQRAIVVKDALTEQHGLALDRAFVQRQALQQQSGKAEVSLSILTE